MSLIKAFINRKNEVGLKKAIWVAVLFVWNKVATYIYSALAWTDYRFNKNALKQSIIDPLIDNESIRKEFIDSELEVVDYRIDKGDFDEWLQEISFPESYASAYKEAFTEKALEHYLSAKILDLNKEDIFVDVAASLSPWYDLSEKHYKCRSFAVDLLLPPSENDSRLIECDATNIPFESESVTKMALHCAYEVFENDADINLIKEAERVLRPGGRIVIIPLYMDHFYGIRTGLKANRKGIQYGKAKRVWNDVQLRRRFCRQYSVEAFKQRTCNNGENLDVKIYYFTNPGEMKQNPEDRVYVKFAACLTKKE